MKAGRPRRVTETQIAKLRAWRRGDRLAFWRIAQDMGLSANYAAQLRTGNYTHKQASP